MKVTNDTVLKIDRRCINKLAYELSVHTNTIERSLKDNEENGLLTTMLAVKVISQETGIDIKKVLTDK